MKIGAQLFTVRELCKTEAETKDTLARIADIGYRYVQLSGICPYDAAEMKNTLDSLGLRCVITHTSFDTDLEQKIKDHDALDCKYVGIGGYFGFKALGLEKGMDELLARFGPITERLSAAGKYFMYHNHAHEFAKLNGKCILELIANGLDKKDCGFTFDTYWAQHAGADPARWIEELSERVPCIHLKDHAFDGKMAVVGEGNINFDRVFEKAEGAGVEYMLVEQDDCYGEDPIACLARSYNNLHALGFN